MERFASAALVAAMIFLAACGSTQKGNGVASATSPATPSPAAATAGPGTVVDQAQVIRVPVASSKKFVLHMTGPKTVTEARDWPSFKEEWRATFAEYAKDKGIAFSMQEGDTRVVGEPGTLLDVYVNDYRQVGIGARIFFGVMTGNAYIDAKVSFVDLSAGQPLGEQTYNTSSSAWAGVFGKMTPQQVDTIGSAIFSSIKAR